MDQQRMDAKKMFKELSFGKKIEHIWFYYKRLFLVIFLVLLLVGYGVYEVVSKPDYDLEGTFYASAYISEEQMSKMEEYFSRFVEDRNGDGKKNVKLSLVSEASIGGDAQSQMIVNTRFSSEMAAGINSFIIVDDSYFELLEEDIFSEAIGSPQELTALSEFRTTMNFREDLNVYWVTRELYSEEKEDPKAIQVHNTAVSTEKNIFSQGK